jgi:dihydroorotase-like cyclic amidohydrolase
VSNYDLIIQNGTVATAADVFQADIGIKDGKIVQIGQSLSGAARTIDASGKYVLPGGIDIAIWDPAIERTIRHADLHDGADYSPYEGIEITGWPITTIVAGKPVVENGVLVGTKGHGQYRKAAARQINKQSNLTRATS